MHHGRRRRRGGGDGHRPSHQQQPGRRRDVFLRLLSPLARTDVGAAELRRNMTQLDKVRPESRLFERVSAFLGAEAGLLDGRDWHEWLALYAADARYWAPVWVDDHVMTS